MDATELTELMELRHATLSELLELSERQVAAIDDGRMSDLMRVLSDKQAPLGRLHELAQRLRAAVGDDPGKRTWPSEQARLRCRSRQDECEAMHLELLAIEAECETALQNSRHSIEQELGRIDNGRRAATTYAQTQGPTQRGGQLDLSSL